MDWRDSEVLDLREKLTQAEARLQEQAANIRELELRRAQYDSILENMKEYVERSGPDYSLRYVNEAMCRLFNCRSEDLLGQNTMELLVKEDSTPIFDVLQDVSPENPHYRCEYRVRQEDGNLIWVESFGRAFYDRDGNLLEYQDVAHDITHYKNMQEELERAVSLRTEQLNDANRALTEANLYLQNILGNITEGIVAVDAEGHCEFLNYGPDNMWKDAEKELQAFLEDKMRREKYSLLGRLFRKGVPFWDLEVHCPYKEKGIDFILSGITIHPQQHLRVRHILILKPVFHVHRMVNTITGAQARFSFPDIVTNSAVMFEAIDIARQAASSDCNITIEGESGTGKELFAQSIHNSSSRRKGPFVAVNCGSIPRELIASELFGYEEGAYTGAKKGGKPGKFELASGGTLFLDEIGDMPLEQQIVLLRAIQERMITRVGGTREIPVDVRIICATNRKLQQEAMDKSFRQDLYYRINVINLSIPPLRDRKEDILLLFATFLKNAGMGPDLNLIESDVLRTFMDYDWPGNVRELQNIAERMLFLSENGMIMAKYLPRQMLEKSEPDKKNPAAEYQPPSIGERDDLLDIRRRSRERHREQERQTLLTYLQEADGNIALAARRMGIARSSFYRRLQSLDIKDGDLSME